MVWHYFLKMSDKKTNWANYYKTCRVVGYVRPLAKDLIITESREYNIAMSDIVCKAMDEYYERRPELVKTLKERSGKNKF